MAVLICKQQKCCDCGLQQQLAACKSGHLGIHHAVITGNGCSDRPVAYATLHPYMHPSCLGHMPCMAALMQSSCINLM